MSKSRKINFQCEHCNRTFEAEIFDSVNVTLDPELREKVLSGDIYLYKCPHCNKINIIQYPILYHDMNNKILVQYGKLSDIYKFKHFYESDCNNVINDLANEDINDFKKYKVAGVSSWTDLVTTIIAFENDLERGILYLMQYININQYKEYAKKNNKHKYFDSCYRYDENGNIVLSLEVGDEDRPTGSIVIEFEKDIYDSFDSEIFDSFEYCDKFYLDMNKVIRILELQDEYDLSYLKSMIIQLALIELRSGEEEFAEIKKIDEEEYSVDDFVTIEDEKGCPHEARILSFEEISFLDIPIEPKNMKKLLWKNKGKELVTTGDFDDELDNEELSEKLLAWKETKKNFPNSEINDSDIIVGMTASFSVGVLENLKPEDLKVSESILPENIKLELASLENEEGNFLKVYLDQSDFDKNDIENRVIYNFDDIINFTINSGDKYGGIVVITSNEKVFIPNSYLLNVYKIDKILTNKKKMVNLLEKLTNDEIKYMEEFNFKIICMVYFEGKNPSEIADELCLDSTKIAKALNNGYSKLKTIVKYNY